MKAATTAGNCRNSDGKPKFDRTLSSDHGGSEGHVAAYGNDVDELRRLAICLLTATDDRCMKPAHWAALSDSVAALQCLQELVPATLEAEDEHGKTPAHCAADNNNVAALMCLQKLVPATLRAEDDDGMQVAHYAAKHASVTVLQWLHEVAPATLTAVDEYGYTPAHWAALSDSVAALQCLQELVPATLEAEDESGKTPAHCAADNESLSALSYLKAHRHDLQPSSPSTHTARSRTFMTRTQRMLNQLQHQRHRGLLRWWQRVQLKSHTKHPGFPSSQSVAPRIHLLEQRLVDMTVALERSGRSGCSERVLRAIKEEVNRLDLRLEFERTQQADLDQRTEQADLGQPADSQMNSEADAASTVLTNAMLTEIQMLQSELADSRENLHSQLKERDDKLVDLQEANAQFNTSILVTQCLCRLCLELCLLKSSVLLCSWVGPLIVSIVL